MKCMWNIISDGKNKCLIVRELKLQVYKLWRCNIQTDSIRRGHM